MVRKMAKKKIYSHELIGKKMEVISSANPNNLGIKGAIIDETKQTIKIKKDDGREITFLKNIIIFKLLETGELISGKEITKRPEDRLKGN